MRLLALDTWVARQRGDAHATANGWEVHVVVYQDSSVLANDHARVAARNIILHAGELLALPSNEVISEGVIDTRYTTPELDLVGSKEVAALLNVSRQRVTERRAEGRLPEREIQLAATPVWSKWAIDRFVMGWRRKLGSIVPQENFESLFR